MSVEIVFGFKGLATRSDENEPISFIARPATQTRRHTSSTKRWKEHNVFVLLLNQLYCLKISRGFRFLKQKTTEFTTLQKKYIV